MSDAPLTQADQRRWWLVLLSNGRVEVVTPTPGDRSWCVVPKARLVEVERERDGWKACAEKYLGHRHCDVHDRAEEYREALELIRGSHRDDAHDLARAALESTKPQNDSVIPSSEASDE